jgi:hypothetical protein
LLEGGRGSEGNQREWQLARQKVRRYRLLDGKKRKGLFFGEWG